MVNYISRSINGFTTHSDDCRHLSGHNSNMDTILHKTYDVNILLLHTSYYYIDTPLLYRYAIAIQIRHCYTDVIALQTPLLYRRHCYTDAIATQIRQWRHLWAYGSTKRGLTHTHRTDIFIRAPLAPLTNRQKADNRNNNGVAKGEDSRKRSWIPCHLSRRFPSGLDRREQPGTSAVDPS